MKPKKAKKQRPNISLSLQDIEAILCSLPLIEYLETGSEAQDTVNKALAVTATQKIMSHNSNFVPNEIRIIYTAIACAVNLETFFPGAEIDPNWKAEIQRHFFTLNRLYSLTKDYILADN